MLVFVRSLRYRGHTKGMVFEIWSVQSGNVMATFRAEDEAWHEIGRLGQHFGPNYLAQLALTQEQEDGKTVTLAEGIQLATRLGLVNA